MSNYGFADRLGHLTALTPGERDALRTLEDRDRPLRRGAVLVRENDANADLFVLKKGMLSSYVLLRDGSRQILRFLFPGDLVATGALLNAKSPETIAALTDSVVAPIDRSALAGMLGRHPRLATLLIAVGQSTQLALSDRLVALGRTSAKARIAALLLDIREGVRRTDPAAATVFPLVLTQEEIGDAAGLTAVHVNRMFRELEADRLILREAGRVRLLDEAGMVALANYVDRADSVDVGWAAAARR